VLIVNLGCDLVRPSIADPLLAPPAGRDWRVLWSSEDPRYGGAGTPLPWTIDGRWFIAGHSALLIAAGA
jgi:maltooligosyltrehalose trehalohydrolase